jgi:hypothetical protein
MLLLCCRDSRELAHAGIDLAVAIAVGMSGRGGRLDVVELAAAQQRRARRDEAGDDRERKRLV